MLLVLALLGCVHKAPDDSPLPAVCNGGSAWDGASTVFQDESEAWGITEIQPVGVRISAIDFDGDGWTDLVVRRDGAEDDWETGASRATWLLRNVNGERFEDITQASGVTAGRDDDPGHDRTGPNWIFADVDNDGDLDIYTGLPDANNEYDEVSEIRLNNGDGTFELTHGGDVQVSRGDVPYGAAFTDYDRDGLIDLFTGQYYEQDRLYRGDGSGSFEDVTFAAGLRTRAWQDIDVINRAEAHSAAWAALACDLNNDQWPELLASSYGRAPNELWQSAQDGSFTNQSVASGYAFDDRTDWSDNESARCWCMLHPTSAGCDGVPAPEHIACNTDEDAFRWDDTYDREPFRLGGNSGGTTCADVNNDGWLDLLTSEIVHWDVGSSSDPSELLFNTQEADVRFERPGNEVTGLTRTHDIVDWNDGDITGSVFDFDNDGWPDVYIGSSDYPGARGLLFRQVSPERFEPVPTDLGIDHMRSHGSAIADFDHDGDLDIVVGHSSARCDSDCYSTFAVRFFENQSTDGNFVELRLEGGEGSNRSAIGARVELTADGVTQTRLIDGGHGQFGQQDDLVAHFGLGAACEATVRVVWPDAAGTTQSFTVGGGYRYLVHQGQDPVAELP